MRFRPGETETWKTLREEAKAIARQYERERKASHPAKRKRARSPRKTGPKGCADRSVKFSETPVGHWLFVYAPVEYRLLMEWSKTAPKGYGMGKAIKYEQIEAISQHSDNPAFKSAGFHRALVHYKLWGVRPKRKKAWTLPEAVYYARHSHVIHEMIKRCTEA